MKGTYYQNKNKSKTDNYNKKDFLNVENNRKDVIIDFQMNKFFLRKYKASIHNPSIKYKEFENEYDHNKYNNKVI
jgi:hypothetical protein